MTVDQIANAILPAIYAEYFSGCREYGGGPEDEHWRKGLAKDAYAMADAMLAEKAERESLKQIESEVQNG